MKIAALFLLIFAVGCCKKTNDVVVVENNCPQDLITKTRMADFVVDCVKNSCIANIPSGSYLHQCKNAAKEIYCGEVTN